MQQPWLQERIYLDQSTFNARDQATCWEFPHLHGYTICWWVLHKDEDHIPAYGTGLCVIKYFLQAPTGNLFSCTKCYSISICKFAVGYATSIYFLEGEFFFFQFWFYIYTEMDFFLFFLLFLLYNIIIDIFLNLFSTQILDLVVPHCTSLLEALPSKLVLSAQDSGGSYNSRRWKAR